MTDVKGMFEAVKDNDFDFDFETTTGQRTKIIDYHSLIPSEKNRVLVQTRVSQLAESIKLHGKLLEDIIAVDNHDGTYIVLSGHHRLAAIQQLVEIECLKEFSKVRIKIEERNALDNELTMIDCNLEREELSSYDKMMAIGRKEEILIQKKKKNELQYEGSTRSYIAASNQLSDTQVGVYLRVYKKGINPIKNALKDNVITITQAYDISIYDQDEQKKKLHQLSNQKKAVASKVKQQDSYLENLKEKIEGYMQSIVTLNKNTLSFKYGSLEQLKDILEKLHLDEVSK